MAGRQDDVADPVAVALFAELLAAVAEEMGAALQRAAFSPNVKERRDYSCAVFLGDGTMCAQAAHIPVHLGATPLSVAAVLEDVRLEPGDEIVLNDPFRGGTHLPDVTVVRPVFLAGSSDSDRPDFLVANRAHHADIGGASPGSMGLAADIHGEGFRIPPVHLQRRGEPVAEFRKLFRAQVRQPDEREGDLRAQSAANLVGARRLEELAREHGLSRLRDCAALLPAVTERALRRELRELPREVLRFRDALDDDGLGHGPLPIVVAITRRGDGVVVDFAGTAPQTAGPVNANLAVTLAAVGYAFRCLLTDDVPANGGILRPIDVRAPAGSLVNALPPAAVAAGNVETSQRIVDVVFGALSKAFPSRIPAASAGTMTNLTLGGAGFTYYETIGGGAGATRSVDGASALQTHMTNTRNTPIEMLERDAPVRVVRYAVRRRSGGSGARRGGDGIVRAFEACAPMTVTVVADRSAKGPYGLKGGAPGAPGRTGVLRAGGRRRAQPAKVRVQLDEGDGLIMETPGGGGHGRKAK